MLRNLGSTFLLTTYQKQSNEKKHSEDGSGGTGSVRYAYHDARTAW